MPDIKLKNGAGLEKTYTGVDTITVPLADGTGSFIFGLTDEDLTFKGGGHIFTSSNEHMLGKYIPRIKIIPIKYSNEKYLNLIYTFDSVSYKDVSSLIIDCSDTDIFNVSYFINFCSNLEKLPKVINNENTYLSMTSAGLVANSGPRITEYELLEFIKGFTKTTNRAAPGNSNSNLYISLISTTSVNILDPSEYFAHIHKIINHPDSFHAYSSNPSYSLEFTKYCKSIRNVPIQYTDTTPRTSNFDIISNYNYPMLTNSFEFATNNSEPYIMPWKSQVIDLSKSGYSQYNYNYISDNIDNNRHNYWDLEYNIFQKNSGNTLEEVIERYNTLKVDGHYYGCVNQNYNYEGSNVPMALLFSRYNHDSAVATINSLPDTSAYLATAGGTNTIKFNGKAGALTDGGAINTLTEEEIAVAAAKGWTVSLV